MGSAFEGCTYLTYIAPYGANFGNVLDMSSMFKDCISFNGDISWWSAYRITNTNSMFYNATSYNPSYFDLPTSLVTDMSNMFYNATSFNPYSFYINTSSVTDMSNMFYNATSFNNEDISRWNTATVTNMSSMFYNAASFNQNISNWNTAAVTNMSNMFYNAIAFNQNIANWNTALVTDMSNMFYNAISFDKNIGNWNTGLVTDMNGMFHNATYFNQNIENWNTTAVTNMSNMFHNATAFNQNIGNWNIESIIQDGSETGMNNMLDNSGLNITNYDMTITAWRRQSVNPNINLGANGLKYCASSLDRNVLTSSPNNWTITGDMLECHPFRTTWVTDNNQIIILTLASSGTYNYDITWTNLTNAGVGDGSSTGRTGNYTITGLENNSTYEVAITGDFPHLNMNNHVTEKLKLRTIEEWGTISWKSMEKAFYGCSNLTSVVNDVPNLSKVTNTSYMFSNCTSFNANIDSWNTKTVEDMSYMFNEASNFNGNMTSWNTTAVTTMNNMFYNATSFNQNISNWSISNVVSMDNMLDNTDLNIANYDDILKGWAIQAVQANINLGALGLKYCNALSERNILTSLPNNWIITGDIQECRPFRTTWITDNNQIIIPTTGTGYNYNITWTNLTNAGVGNGSDIGITTNNYIITGLENGSRYEVAISGDFPRIYIDSYYNTEKLKIRTIEEWGTIAWKSMEKAFFQCSNLTYRATDSPNLNQVINMSNMFAGCISFNGNSTVNNWDTKNVEIMSSLFSSNHSFNQPLYNWDTGNVVDMSNMFSTSRFNQAIGNWDTKNVTNMAGMFYSAYSFNQPIGNWNTRNVIDMSVMFYLSNYFNQPIGNWDTRNVTDMSQMFGQAKRFNQPIDNWNVSKVENMYRMFTHNAVFNQPLGNWDTRNVTKMGGMFERATAFNQDISNWNTSKVYDMQCMFCYSPFNQPIGNWNVSNVWYIRHMFNNTSFNQDISNWNTESVIDMNSIFANNTSFNQDISNWNTENVKYMQGAFNGATSFNQDISNWNTQKVEYINNMFDGAASFNQNLGNWNITSIKGNPYNGMDRMLSNSGLNIENYDATLIAWAVQTVKSDIKLGADGLEYCAGTDARNKLITNSNWIITGDTQGGTCPEINLQSNTTDIANGNTTPVVGNNTDFGNVTTSRIVTYTIQNTGTASLTISSINVTGTNNTEFVVSGFAPNTVITGGNDITFNVTFTPSATGVRTATITINSDDADEAAYDFVVQGTKINPIPEIAIFGNSTEITNGDTSPSATDNTDLLDGNAPLAGCPSVSKIFTITNQGTADLILGGNVTLSGSANFAITTQPSNLTITAGNSESFMVTYTPTQNGTETATISISSNDADESPYTFTVQGAGFDGMPPIVNPYPTTITAECGFTPPTLYAENSVLDRCGGSPFTGVPNTTFPMTTLGTSTVTWTFTDPSGNTTTASQDITITADATAPIAPTLSDITAACSVTSLTPPTASDACAGSITGTTTATLPITNTSVITWTFDDGNGNTSTSTQNIIITDNVVPTASCQSITVALDATGNVNVAASQLDNGSSDNCSGTLSRTINGTSSVAFTCANIGVNNVTLSVTDANGNSSTCTATITVLDNTPPAIPTLTNVTAQCSVASIPAPTTTDICAGTITGTTTQTFPITSSTTVVWTFNDGNGNTVTANQTVTISETGEINLLGNGISIVDGNATPSLTENTDFGTVTTNKVVTYTIQNMGTANLTVASIDVTGINNTEFVVSGFTPNTVITAGNNITFDVTFTPAALGIRTATITVNSDDCDEGVYDFEVQGTKVAANFFVKAAGGSDTNGGTSFTDAFATLERALSSANFGDKIYVAKGTYKPTQQYNFRTGSTSTGDPRAVSFKIPNGIEIYGGFMGTETGGITQSVLDNRIFDLNTTILSGDIDGSPDNVTGTFPNLVYSNYEGNAYHVVYTRNVTSIILDGFTIKGGNATNINNFNFQYTYGGGWLNLTENSGSSSNPTLINCSFYQNNADNGGGVGEFLINGVSNPTLINCSFYQNNANNGGGMSNRAGGDLSPILMNCSFYQNNANDGGGMYNIQFGGNYIPKITNSVFYQNNAGRDGGGLYNQTTFFGITKPTLTNCIFWNNTAVSGNSWRNFDSGSLEIAYSLVSEVDANTITNGNYISTVVGDGMVYAKNPLFTDAINGDFSLQNCSPAINSGNNIAIPIGVTEDLLGNPRIYNNGTVDMGPYEYQAIPILPEIELQSNSINIADGSTIFSTSNNTDFGSVATNKVVTYTIQNTGTTDLTISSIDVTGTNNTEFVVSTLTFPLVIAANSSTTFNVTFTPTALLGTRTATITVNSDDCDEAVYDFEVQGTKINAPQITLLGNTNPITNGSNTPSTTNNTDFGQTPSQKILTYTIQNTGTADLNVSSIGITGGNVGEFVVSGFTPNTVIAAGNDITFSVTFNPYSVGVRNVVATINSNDANNPTYTFAIRAEGVPEINVAGNSSSIASGSTSTSTTNYTDMGSTIQPITKTFHIQNIGVGNLNVTNIVSSNPLFTVSNVAPSFAIPAFSEVGFDVTFTPTTESIQTSTITITNDDTDEPSYTFVVKGEGFCPVTPAISASTTPVLPRQVGSIRLESKNSVSYQLQNVTAGNINIGSPVQGNGDIIYLQTPILMASTDFRVVASRNLCGNQILNTVTIPVALASFGYTQTQINDCTPSSSVADIDVSMIGSTYLWNNSTTNQNLTDATNGIYSLTIDGSTTLPVIVGTPVEWEKPIRSTLTNEGRIKANGTYSWNSEAAAISKAKLASGENGGFTLVVEDMATISDVMIGLAEPNNEASYASLGNCFYVTASGELYFYWNNLSNSITSATTVSIGDRITILREGSSIKYYHNTELIHTDTQTANATKELVVDIALTTGTSPQVWFSKCNNSNFEVNYVQNTVNACNTTTGEAQITLSPQGGIAPYTYNWSNGANAIANPTGMQTGLTSVQVTDDNSYQKTLPIIIGNPVNWTSLQNTSATQGKLFALGFANYSNAGAISPTGMGANTDGGITYIYQGSNSDYMIGLSAQNTDPNWTSLEYSTYIEGNTLYLYEGTSVVSLSEDVKSQDRISIIRKGNKIIYYQNSKELHRLTVDPTVDLFADATVASGQTPAIYASWCTASTTDLGLNYTLTAIDDCTTGANEGAVSMQGNGGTAAYTYTWNDANTDNPRTGLARGIYEVTLESGATNLTSPIIVGGFANWGNLTANTTQVAGKITATTPTDWATPEGGLSTNRLAANTDGGISFVVTTQTGLSNYQIGLSSTTSTDTDWDNINYAVWINAQNTVRIYESGVDKGAIQAVTIGDRISIIRKSGNIEYYVNSKLIRTTTTGTVTQELAADISIIDGTSPAVFTSFCNTGFRIPNKVKANETEEDTFSIYPNPSTGTFNVRFGTVLSADTQVTIFDGIGRKIKTQTFEKGSQKFAIDLKNQPKGMYLIHFNQNGATYSKAVIVE